LLQSRRLRGIQALCSRGTRDPSGRGCTSRAVNVGVAGRCVVRVSRQPTYESYLPRK
jgi:hypothetical protein